MAVNKSLDIDNPQLVCCKNSCLDVVKFSDGVGYLELEIISLNSIDKQLKSDGSRSVKQISYSDQTEKKQWYLLLI